MFRHNRGGLLTALVALIALALTPIAGSQVVAAGDDDPAPNSGVVRD